MKKRLIWALVLSAPITYIVTRGYTLDPEARAKALCRGEIKHQLKDPSSAEFGAVSARKTSAGVWLVYREVTAKNSFGVMLKSAQLCTISPDFSTIKVQ